MILDLFLKKFVKNLDGSCGGAGRNEKTWRIYKEMRDELVAWLSDQTVAVAPQAGVKALRLAQICSGFVGGVQDEDSYTEPKTEEIGEEKLDMILAWIVERFEVEPNEKLLIWSRFRPEVKRLYDRTKLLDLPAQSLNPGRLCRIEITQDTQYRLRLRTNHNYSILDIHPKGTG